MTVKKFERLQCDRCGREADRPEDGENHGWQIAGFPDPNHTNTMPPKADLCPDCRTSLVQWWRGGRPRKEPSQRG